MSFTILQPIEFAIGRCVSFVMWCIVVSYYLFAGSFASLFTLHEYLYHMTCISLCKSTCVDSFHLLVTGMLSRSHSGKSKVKAISSQRSLLKFTRIQWSSGLSLQGWVASRVVSVYSLILTWLIIVWFYSFVGLILNSKVLVHLLIFMSNSTYLFLFIHLRRFYTVILRPLLGFDRFLKYAMTWFALICNLVFFRPQFFIFWWLTGLPLPNLPWVQRAAGPWGFDDAVDTDGCGADAWLFVMQYSDVNTDVLVSPWSLNASVRIRITKDH